MNSKEKQAIDLVKTARQLQSIEDTPMAKFVLWPDSQKCLGCSQSRFIDATIDDVSVRICIDSSKCTLKRCPTINLPISLSI